MLPLQQPYIEWSLISSNFDKLRDSPMPSRLLALEDAIHLLPALESVSVGTVDTGAILREAFRLPGLSLNLQVNIQRQ